ncbi:MAG: TetR family transcriptional regulator, partial [Bdellovibrionia bacterium]
ATDSKDPTREQLMKAASHLFAKHGFDGVTVRDIAQAAEVNVAAVSYHFEGKEGLYRAVIEEFAHEKKTKMQSMLSKAPQNVQEYRILQRLLLYDFLSDVIANPHHCQILMKEIDAGLPMAADIFEKTMMQNFKMIMKVHEDAQEKGFLRKDLDPKMIALIIQGIVFHMQRVEGIRKRFFKESLVDEKTRQQTIDQICTVLLDGMIDARK